MKWGLVPSFTKKTEKPDHYKMLNARSESVGEKASFRRLLPKCRCLVAVEGHVSNYNHFVKSRYFIVISLSMYKKYFLFILQFFQIPVAVSSKAFILCYAFQISKVR
ncbi:hypothetical protein K1719_039105 [Acacia pycnantha]|nr:hypothetical protein K1719_039105 [Acacia pycnantha]